MSQNENWWLLPCSSINEQHLEQKLNTWTVELKWKWVRYFSKSQNLSLLIKMDVTTPFKMNGLSLNKRVASASYVTCELLPVRCFLPGGDTMCAIDENSIPHGWRLAWQHTLLLYPPNVPFLFPDLLHVFPHCWTSNIHCPWVSLLLAWVCFCGCCWTHLLKTVTAPLQATGLLTLDCCCPFLSNWISACSPLAKTWSPFYAAIRTFLAASMDEEVGRDEGHWTIWCCVKRCWTVVKTWVKHVAASKISAAACWF